MKIQEGDIAVVIGEVSGEVVGHILGHEVVVKRIYGDECTVEKPDGTGCTTGVPVSRLHLILSVRELRERINMLEADKIQLQMECEEYANNLQNTGNQLHEANVECDRLRQCVTELHATVNQ